MLKLLGLPMLTFLILLTTIACHQPKHEGKKTFINKDPEVGTSTKSQKRLCGAENTEELCVHSQPPSDATTFINITTNEILAERAGHYLLMGGNELEILPNGDFALYMSGRVRVKNSLPIDDTKGGLMPEWIQCSTLLRGKIGFLENRSKEVAIQFAVDKINLASPRLYRSDRKTVQKFKKLRLAATDACRLGALAVVKEPVFIVARANNFIWIELPQKLIDGVDLNIINKRFPVPSFETDFGLFQGLASYTPLSNVSFSNGTLVDTLSEHPNQDDTGLDLSKAITRTVNTDRSVVNVTNLIFTLLHGHQLQSDDKNWNLKFDQLQDRIEIEGSPTSALVNESRRTMYIKSPRIQLSQGEIRIFANDFAYNNLSPQPDLEDRRILAKALDSESGLKMKIYWERGSTEAIPPVGRIAFLIDAAGIDKPVSLYKKAIEEVLNWSRGTLRQKIDRRNSEEKTLLLFETI
jgi:hypothetical protein